MRKLHRNALTALILGNLAIVPAYALAQDAAPPQDAAASQEEPAGEAGEDVTELQAVVVSGEIMYRNRTETTAPELVYGQEFFAEFEPVSVGDQLRRVPGVAFTSDIGESDAPQMRGLGQGFTQVLVNGRPIPGAGNDRTVFVDRIPAEIVDRIEVIRSPSADIDSQGIGGTINIILKDGESLPPGVIARVGVTNSIDADKSRGNGAVSWSGRNKDDTVFFSLTLDAQERYNNKEVTEGVFESDSVGFDEEVARRGDGRRLVHFDDPAASSAVERTEEQDSRDSRDVSFNGDVTWLISEESSLRVDAFALTTKRKEHQDTQIYEGDGSVGGLDMDNPELEFQDADFRQDSFGMSTLFKTYLNPSTQLDIEASYNSFTDEGIEDTFEETSDNLVNREDNDADDVEWSVAASVTRQMNGVAEAIGIEGAQFKAGLVAKSKDRDYSLVIGDGLDDDDYSTNDGRFSYKERRLDGYALVKWEVNDALNLETGVRAEKTRTEQRYSSDFLEGGVLQDTVSGEADNDAFMLNPSAHIQWKLSDADQLRFSAARTVRRPSIDQLIPAFSLESPGDEDATIGNPELDFETSIGLDLGYERRLPDRGIFGINLFYRDISDLIGLVNTGLPVSDIGLDPEDFPGSLYTYRNIGDARVHGIELDLSTPLGFIGLAETGVFANYTRLWSDRDDPATGGSIAIDYQPTYVYNVGLTQNIPSWDASFGFSYQKQGESRFVTYGEIESQLYDGNLEVFIEKRLSKSVVMRLTGSNLLDADSLQAEAGFDGDNGAEIIANQAAYDVDAYEVERENSSPRWTLTLRAVF
ncbi:TonB-dependent receptor plug domain-containing protein [Luteimonas notoginsengisoli]|uniref:TonB-dependent receptor plug domain-containing protein n=1 Tax=Luteimonas notoginsengisoli TaxID=1578200 RepID=A0ABV7URX5_9GAMM